MPYVQAALTPEEEQRLAVQILDLERALMRMLGQIAACAPYLARREERTCTTRHAAVGRISEAIDAARRAKTDPRQLARVVSVWDETQRLRWRLALSAQRVARSEVRRVGTSRVAVEDLDQEAVLGLLAAATRFEPGRGVRFAVYARWWVRAQITRAIQFADMFRLSGAAHELHRNVGKLLHADQAAGVARPLAALAREVGVDPQRLHNVLAAVASKASHDVDNDGFSAIAALPDRGARSPEDHAIDADSAGRLRDLLTTAFSERERHILEHRYGLAVEPRSIASIAATLCLSTERVRQLERECVHTLSAMFQRELDV